MIFQRSLTAGRRSKAGFTLVELLVVIAIISMLAALLMPALHSALNLSKQISCMNNYKQIGLATTLYVDEYDGYYPKGSLKFGTYSLIWHTALNSYCDNPKVFACPADPDVWEPWGTGPLSYMANYNFLVPWAYYNHKVGSCKKPGQRILFSPNADGEGADADYQIGNTYPSFLAAGFNYGSRMSANRHVENANYLFADQHVEMLWEEEAMEKNIWLVPEDPLVWEVP